MNHDVVVIGAGPGGRRMAAGLKKAAVYEFAVVEQANGYTFDEQNDRWLVRTADGEQITGTVLIDTSREACHDKANAYMGVAVAGLPNLFFLPGAKSGQIRYILACLRLMGREDARRIEVHQHVQAPPRRWRRKPDPRHYMLTPFEDDLDETHRSPAIVTADGVSVEVEVHLAGHVQPIDGSYRWYGRIAANPEVTALQKAGRKEVTVRISGGAEATGRLTEVDPWGNVRVTGTGRPPFPQTPW